MHSAKARFLWISVWKSTVTAKLIAHLGRDLELVFLWECPAYC